MNTTPKCAKLPSFFNPSEKYWVCEKRNICQRCYDVDRKKFYEIRAKQMTSELLQRLRLDPMISENLKEI